MADHDLSPFSPRDAVDTNEFDLHELALTAPGPIPFGGPSPRTPRPLDESLPSVEPAVDPATNRPTLSPPGRAGSADRSRFAVGVLEVLKVVAVLVAGLVVVGLVRSMGTDSDGSTAEPPVGVVSAGSADDAESDGSVARFDSGSSGNRRSRFGAGDGESRPDDGGLGLVAEGDGLPSNSLSGTNSSSSPASPAASSTAGSRRQTVSGGVLASGGSGATTTTTGASESTSSSDTGSTITTGGPSTSSTSSGSTATTTSSSSSSTDTSSGDSAPTSAVDTTNPSNTTSSTTGSTSSPPTSSTTTDSMPATSTEIELDGA